MPDRPLSRRWTEEERRIRLDALLLWWPYADGSLRDTIEVLLEEGRSEVWNAENEERFLACAAGTWPRRLAAKRFAAAEPGRFWDVLLPRCLPTTQFLLLRLREQEGGRPFDELLRSPQADLALHDRERMELELLVPQVRALLWREARDGLGEAVATAEREREERRATLHAPSSGAAGLSAFEHEMVYGA